MSSSAASAATTCLRFRMIIFRSTRKTLDAGQRTHAPVETEYALASGPACLGDNQAVREIGAAGLEAGERVAHGRRRFEGNAGVVEQGAHRARNIDARESIAFRQRPAQFDQHDVGHEQPAVLVGMRVESGFGALRLLFVVRA